MMDQEQQKVYCFSVHFVNFKLTLTTGIVNQLHNCSWIDLSLMFSRRFNCFIKRDSLIFLLTFGLQLLPKPLTSFPHTCWWFCLRECFNNWEFLSYLLWSIIFSSIFLSVYRRSPHCIFYLNTYCNKQGCPADESLFYLLVGISFPVFYFDM